MDGWAGSSEAASLCGAMTVLSYHADAATLSRFVEAGVPVQLAGLLHQILRVWDTKDPATAHFFALSRALLLLGNVEHMSTRPSLSLMLEAHGFLCSSCRPLQTPLFTSARLMRPSPHLPPQPP